MIEIEVEDAAWTAALPDVDAVVLRAATAALGAVEGDVVVLLTDDAEAEEMEAEEREILAALGVADPYAIEHEADA